MDVEPTPAHRTAEVESTKTMIDRVEAQFDIKPERLVGDTAYGTAPMLAWMVEEKDIEPHEPVWDKTERKNDSFSSNDFRWNEETENTAARMAMHYVANGEPSRTSVRTSPKQHHHFPIPADRLRCLSDESQVLPEHGVPQDRPQRPRSRARCGSANRSDTCVRALSPRT